MRGPLLLLLVACLSAVFVGAVVEGSFWFAVVVLALALGVGALLLSTRRSGPDRRSDAQAR